jgi:hypothetical protein
MLTEMMAETDILEMLWPGTQSGDWPVRTTTSLISFRCRTSTMAIISLDLLPMVKRLDGCA